MICNRRYLLVLVVLLGLPVFASDSHSWSFNGTDYELKTSDSEVSVEVKRQHELTTKQMKSLCRKGLGLELRKKYEDKLLEGGFIRETLDSWYFCESNLRTDQYSVFFSEQESSSVPCECE